MKILSNNTTQFFTIILLVIIAYWPTFSGDFILDDHELVKNNKFIKESQSLTQFFNQEDGVADLKDLGVYHSGYYRPLINMTYRFDYLLWGMDARGFRITNVILHLICCFILLLFFTHFLGKNAAFWVTVLFALHPANTEAVSFIAARNNIIVTIFFIGSLFSFIIAQEKNKLFFYIFTIIFFTGAIFSKEYGLMVIPLIFFYQRLLADKKHGFLKESVIYFFFMLVLVIYFILRKGVTDSVLTPLGIGNIWERVLYVPFIVFYYLKIIFSPYKLHYFYIDYPENIFSWFNIILYLFLIIIIFIAWIKRKNRLMTFSILAFIFCIFPVLNIIPTSSVSLIAMRWLYLPLTFLLLPVGYVIKKAIIWKRDLTIYIFIILITYLAGYTFILNRGLWHDDDILIKQEVLGFNNMLFAPDIAEKYYNNMQYLNAEKYFKISIEKFPFQALNFLNYSALLVDTNRPSDAVTILDKSKSLVMTYHEQGRWYNNMGMALWKKGDTLEALDFFHKAVQRVPEEAVFWVNLGGAYGNIGKYEESIKIFKNGILASPDSIELKIKLARSYMHLNDYKKAILTLKEIPKDVRNVNNDILLLIEKAEKGSR
jgi:protein O-mannosyl-transferase